MSSSSFRDSVVVIIDNSRSLIRAGIGLNDLLRTPSVVSFSQTARCNPSVVHTAQQEMPARVGLRRSTVSGEVTTARTNGDASAEASTSSSKLPIPVVNAKVTEYLVGTQLDEALASGQEVDVYWPFADGDVSDWTQAEALWCGHCLFYST